MVEEAQTMSQPRDSDPYVFPGDLPVPVDDGACAHLEGTRIPRIALRSTKGRKVNVAATQRTERSSFSIPRPVGQATLYRSVGTRFQELSAARLSHVRSGIIIESSKNSGSKCTG